MKFYICSVILYFITVVLAALKIGLNYKDLSLLKNIIIGPTPIVNIIFIIGQIFIILFVKKDKYNN